jgi:peptidoglycan/LPS O-acetylase OafA/YrhL
MELDNDSSARLNLIRFPLIVGIVFIHAYQTSLEFGSTQANVIPTGFLAVFIRDFFSVGLAGIAVPLFFFMSGFLFFYKLDWSSRSFLKKLRTRVRTLLIPFLFWNILYLLVIAIAQNISFTSSYFAGGIPHITSAGVYDYFNLIIGIDRHPIGFQFWYIRDLMILVLLTPVFHLMHKKTAWVFLAIFFGVWFSGYWFNDVLSIIPSPVPVFFFYAGTVLAVKNKTPFLFEKFNIILIIACLVIVFTFALLQDQSQAAAKPWLYRTGILVGIFAAFGATRYLFRPEKVKTLFLWLGTTSFFIFAFHEPLMDFLQRVVVKYFVPSNDFLKLLFYFAIPIVVILVSLLVYKVLGRLLPKLTSIITGGRASVARSKPEGSAR